MATVNDGTAKWELYGLSGDLDLENLKSIVSTKSDVYVGYGTFTNETTVPLPSGYSRSQCKIAYFPISSSRSAKYGVEWFRYCTVNQSTGQLIGYICSSGEWVERQSGLRSEYFYDYAYIIIGVK